MEEVNKKKILKYHSYKNNAPVIQKEFSTIKSDIDENQLNRSILRKDKKSDNKKVLFNFSKFRIKKPANNPVQISSNANESLLKTNNMKNKTDSVESLKKNSGKKLMNSNNEFTNNYVISTNHKTLYKNKSQENLSTNLLQKKNYLNSNIKINDSHGENFFDLDSINDINNAINSQLFQNTKSNKSNKTKNLKYENNQESFGNFDYNTITANTHYPFKKIVPKNNEKTLPKLNETKRRKKNMSFLIKSKKNITTANDIIIHYLKENERDNTKNIPFNNFKKYLKNIDYGKFNYGLDKIYGNSEKFLRRVEEIKKNNIIAYKKDFNIEDYQTTLLKILKKRVSLNNYIKLQESYKLFNERNYGMIIPRGRYINLAEKLKDFLSKDIYEKMKRTDKKYILYLYKKQDQKHKMAEESQNRESFYKKLNQTLRVFSRKRRRNKSY